MLKTRSSNLQLFLDRLTMRSVLSDQEKRRILGLPFRVRQARPNEDFVALGQRVDSACFVLDGMVGRFDQNSSGDRQITALHIRGDMPDLHSVVQPWATSALQALTTSTILQVPHAALRAAAAEHPAIAEAFWRDCMVDSMILAQWVVNVGRRNARSRVAHLLCEMTCRYQAAGDLHGLALQLPMTQSHLADATGLTSVHVNRTLGSLALIGTTFRHGKLRIENWAALVEVGDFDAAYLQADLDPEERIRLVQ